MRTTSDRGHLPLAVDRNGELHETDAIERAPAALAPPLRCADCGAALEAVRAHPRRARATIVHVAAHYRLAPGAMHAPSCPWRAPSPAPCPSARQLPQTPPQMYSLVVPGRRTPRPVWRQRAFRAPRRPAFNSAARVADVLAQQGGASSQPTLDFRGHPVAWHDFLFGCADAARLGQYLQSAPTHPIAVHGRLGEHQMARTGESHLWTLHDPSAAAGSPRGTTRVLLRSSHRQLLSDLVEKPIVALGWWQLRAPAAAAGPNSIVLWVNNRWQLAACRPLTS